MTNICYLSLDWVYISSKQWNHTDSMSWWYLWNTSIYWTVQEMFESQVYPYDGPILFQTVRDMVECEACPGDDPSQFRVHVCVHVHVHVDSMLRPYPWKYIHFSNWSRHSRVLDTSLFLRASRGGDGVQKPLSRTDPSLMYIWAILMIEIVLIIIIRFNMLCSLPFSSDQGLWAP